MRDWTPGDIKELRQSLNLTQKAFADLLGVTRNFIYYLERGEREASKTLKLLMDCVERQFKETEKGKENRRHGKRSI
jgi:DNA-binding transcriptional regulator YiaG